MPLLKNPKPVAATPPPARSPGPPSGKPLNAFDDGAGRTWLLVIDLPALRRIEQFAGENLTLLLMSGGETQAELAKLITDPVRLSSVLWGALEPDATAAGITSDEFYGGLRFSALQQAGVALIEGLADFFDSPLADLLKRLAAFGRNQIASGQRIAEAAMAELLASEEKPASTSEPTTQREERPVATSGPKTQPTSKHGSGEWSPAAESRISEGGDSAN